MSLDSPGRALNKFRDIASKPNMAARDRMVAVGVDGLELLSVENLKSPYCWTVNCEDQIRKRWRREYGLVCTILPGIRSVWIISCSPLSEVSLDVTAKRDNSPARG